MLTIHDIRVKSPCPSQDQGITDCSRNAVIESQVIPSRVIEGDVIESLLLKERDRQRSFIKLCEGVAPSKNHYEARRFTTKPFQKLIEECSHTQMLESNQFDARQSEFDIEATDSVIDLIEDSVIQMYAGVKYDPNGFGGFPEMCSLHFDALQKDLNWTKNYEPGVDFDEDTDRFTTVYLVRIARGRTNAALARETTGLRWVWGGGRTLAFDRRREVSVPTGTDASGCQKYTQRIHQFVEGFLALQSRGIYDVTAIHNVPLFCLDGFHLEHVLNSVYPKFPAQCAPNAIFIDREIIGMWVNSRKAANEECCLKAVDGPLSDRARLLDSFGPNLPIYLSECLPEAKYSAEPNSGLTPVWKKRGLTV